MTSQPEYVTGGWTPQEAWEDLRAILEDPDVIEAIAKRKAFEDRYLVNGMLLLTPRMVLQLHREEFSRPVETGSPRQQVQLLNSIPVKTIAPGQVVDLGEGLKAVTFDERIYVFKMIDLEAKIEPDILASWKRDLMDPGPMRVNPLTGRPFEFDPGTGAPRGVIGP